MPIKILYAEDEPNISSALQEVMSQAGYEVLVCDNGRSVLSALENFKPDLLVLDLMMPGMDGLDIVRQLNADPAKAATPIIVTTALAHAKRTMDEFQQVRHFLVKPFSATTLLQAIKDALKKPAAQQSAQGA